MTKPREADNDFAVYSDHELIPFLGSISNISAIYWRIYNSLLILTESILHY